MLTSRLRGRCVTRATAVTFAVAVLAVLAAMAAPPARVPAARSRAAGVSSPRAAVAATLRSTDPPPEIRPAEQAQLAAIGVTAAWRITRGNGVTVGVLDSGADPTAPDLVGSVTVGPDYTRGADPPGYQPPHLHGTYIASLIAGHGSGPGDAGGIIGVAPAAAILSVRVIPDDQEPGFATYNANSTFDDAIGDGIRYAVSHGASVINMSLGGETPIRNLRAAVGYAIAHDVVVVAAAGNDGATTSGYTPYSYPAAFPGVISVGGGGHQRPPRVFLRPERLRGDLGARGERHRRGTRRKLPARQRHQSRVRLCRRGGGADPVAVSAVEPGAGRAGRDLLGG